jgi:hypothetical protein
MHRSRNVKTKVIGCPKTIDGDLKCKEVPISFGFDTACKVCVALLIFLTGKTWLLRCFVVASLQEHCSNLRWKPIFVVLLRWFPVKFSHARGMVLNHIGGENGATALKLPSFVPSVLAEIKRMFNVLPFCQPW